ncbi:hypothetical protein [Escherichia coli]|uniref:hypothetical protein n=1 Tax=Escherichia coli TaxID=562 RepID=UPI003CFA8B74
MTIKSIVINGKTILSTPNAINEGVLPDRFKSIDGDNPEVEMSEDNSEWEDF